MFFGKEEKIPTSRPEKIAIIGDSALGFFLCAFFHSLGYECKLIMDELSSLSYRKLSPFTIHSSLIPNIRFKPDIVTSIDQDYDFYFIASSAESCHNDIFFLLEKNATSSKIINLSGFYNSRYIKNAVNKEITEGFIKSYTSLNLNKNFLEQFGQEFTLVLRSSSDKGLAIGNLFNDAPAGIDFAGNTQQSFQEYYCFKYISELLFLAHRRKMSEILDKQENRQQVLGLIKECSALLQNKKQLFNEGDILNKLYTIPDDYRGTTLNHRGFINFCNIFPQADAVNTPKLYNLLTICANNYIV